MTLLLARRTTRTIIGLLVLVEAIFLTESFTTILEEAIRNGGTVIDVVFLLVLKLPEVVDFALPLAILIGLFFAVTAARDANELVVCAAAGVPWTRIPVFAGVVGLIGLCVSLLFAGVLTPVSSYAFRLAVTDLQARLIIQEITEPGQRNSLRDLEGRTIIATPSTEPDTKRGNLFVYHPEPGASWRISQADDWDVVGPRDDGGYEVQMRGFREASGTASAPVSQPDSPGSVADIAQRLNMAVSTVTLEFRMEGLLKTANTARQENETLIFDLVGAVHEAAPDSDATPLRRFGELLARALLCPVAALLAVAAAGWSVTPAGRYAALPLAAVLVLAGDVFGRTTLGDAAQVTGPVFWSTLGAVAFWDWVRRWPILYGGAN